MIAASKPGGTNGLKLDCPYCSASVEIPGNQVIDGADVLCPRCHEEGTLIKAGVEHGGSDQWKLIQMEFDDERR